MSYEKRIIVGNLGKDPELNHTQSGKAVCNFSVATSWGEKTEWHRIVAWEKNAENCAKYLSKGKKVLVEGRTETRQWEDKDGNKHWTPEVHAHTVQFLTPKSEGQGQATPDTPPSLDDIPF